jgi:hypothetical protein
MEEEGTNMGRYYDSDEDAALSCGSIWEQAPTHDVQSCGCVATTAHKLSI